MTNQPPNRTQASLDAPHWSIPTGDYVDRAAVIDTLTRLRDGS